VALAYVNARSGDSSLDRLKRAKRLEQLKPNNVESSMIVAQMAMEAGEFRCAQGDRGGAAQRAARRRLHADGRYRGRRDGRSGQGARMAGPRRARAARSGLDGGRLCLRGPGRRSRRSTGRFDAFEWKVPVERLGPVLENDLDPMVPGIAASSAEAPAQAVPAEPAPEPEPEEAGEAEIVAEEIESGPVIEGEAVREPEEKPAGDDAVGEKAKTAPKAEEAQPDKDATADDITVMPGESAAESASAGAKAEQPEKAEQPYPPIPDDPGVDPDSKPEEPSGRFRLF
jgi:HemY protein